MFNKTFFYSAIGIVAIIVASIFVMKKTDIPAPAPEAQTVKAYFLNNRFDPEITCTKVFPVTRTIEKTVSVGRAALEELFKGPTSAEKSDGYFTNINPGVTIQELKIENGIATIGLNTQLEFQVGGSCRVAAIRAQITQTLKQFPTITSVIISVDGRVEDVLQP